jgi:tripartite-type tricarboxylate transporter receptor subunit TctC
VSSWNGLMAPAGVPKEILARLNQAVQVAVKSDSMKTAFTRQGMQAVGSTPDEFASFVRDEYARWANVIRHAGIKAE